MLVQRNSKLFPNFSFPSFLSHSVCAEKGRPCAFDSFTPEIITLSPSRSPVSQEPLETFKPFHPLFKPGPSLNQDPACCCELMNAEGFNQDEKLSLQAVPSVVKSILSGSRVHFKKQNLGEISAYVKTVGAADESTGVSSCKKLPKVDPCSVPCDSVPGVEAGVYCSSLTFRTEQRPQEPQCQLVSGGTIPSRQFDRKTMWQSCWTGQQRG